MNIAITGSTGLIGAAVTPALTAAGHRVIRLVRRPPRPGEDALLWDPEEGRLDPAALEGLHAVIHLAGESIGARRWSPEQKRRILESRVQGTALLARTLAGLSRQPRVLLSASAIGWYGDRGDTMLTETSAAGQGFLAEVCRRWEEATTPAHAAGLRVVLLRTGVVLSRQGGALPRMEATFRAGLGGRLGHGRQWWSVTSLEEVVGMIRFLLAEEGPAGAVHGPVNLVSPTPLTNADFTRALARTLRRPALFAVPAAGLRLALGTEAADEMILASQRVVPRVLTEAGYRFLHADATACLSAALSGT